MAQISKNKKKGIVELYSRGRSVREIAAQFDVSIDAMYYFFRSQGIPRRSLKDSRAAYYDRVPLSYSLNKRLSINEEKLKLAGIMLYWGEGTKWSGNRTVEFVNSDPHMIRIFMRFLREVCGVDENKLRVLLYCHANQSVGSLQKYWSGITEISLKKFTKPYIRTEFNDDKIGKMEYGLIHVRYNDKKLLCQMMDWIEEVKSAF